jgi:hypothetical protein
VIPCVINTMNNAMKKKTIYRRVYERIFTNDI